MALIGNMGEFSEENEDWMQYIERLQFFFMANGIVQEEQKRAILLTVIGPATFRLLKTLVAPRKVGEESFDNLVADMKNHLNPELSEIIQRYKFNSRVRQAHESVAIFNAQLCKLAEHCNFGPVLEDMLRDRLLSGVNDESIQRRLLLERGLTYRRALEIAMEVESLMRDRRQLHHGAMASAWSLHQGTLETVPGNLTQLPNEEQRLQKVKSERSVFVTTAKSPFEPVPGDFENEEPSVCVNECDSTISPDLCELQVVKVEPKEWESWTEQGKLQDVKSESEDSVHARQGMHRKTVELKQDHGWKLSGYEEAPVVDFEKTVEIENSPVVTFGCQQSCNFSEVGKHCGIKFVCSICLVAFSSEDSLAAHEVTHLRENPHKCDVCLKIFNNRQDLLQHQQVHTGEKPFSCEDCGKAFRRKSSLVYHCWSHMEEKPFKCPDCGKGFIAKSQFDQHVRAHKGEKLYACEICGKDFGKKSGLEQHRMVHTGERPFGCNECGRMFRQKRALMVHIRTHTGEKPFDCPICEKAFARKDHLEKHLHVHGETAIRLYESVGSATRSSTAGLLGV